MEKQLQINSIKRKIGQLTIVMGIKQIREAQSEFVNFRIDPKDLKDTLKNNGFDLPMSNLDFLIYTTSWENWQKILDVLWGIIQHFPWEAEVFDCDNRSNLATSLCSMMFRINTLMGAYCEVYDANTGAFKYSHWANMMVSNSKVYFFDPDNNGMRQQVSSNNFVMGGLRYKILSLRVY